MEELDQSWREAAKAESYKCTGEFLRGILQYRNKAIKDLQTIVDLNPYKEGNPYCEGIEQAIQILKDLKAE